MNLQVILIRLKFSGPFIPLPPETIISASATSNLPSDFLNDTTLALRFGLDISLVSTDAASDYRITQL
ncbi:MAG: hypothetical protein MZV64_47420 [Ignavibacteriales bacterium]|nr:hypothetical protein [Ignavibacteriales bacterium]